MVAIRVHQPIGVACVRRLVVLAPIRHIGAPVVPSEGFTDPRRQSGDGLVLSRDQDHYGYLPGPSPREE
jgi:hypothetical protein